MIEAVRRLALITPSPPRIDLEGASARRRRHRRPGSASATTGSSGCWSRRSRARRPAFCSGRRARSGACSSPSTTAARGCSPRTRSSRRPTRGWAVCGVDPRGIGESATDKTGWVFAVSLLLGENFVGRQAWDLGRVLEALGPPGAFPGSPSASTPGARTLASRPRTRSPGRPTPGSPLRWYLLRDGFLSYARSSIARSRCPRPIDSCPRTGPDHRVRSRDPRVILRLRRPPLVRPAPAPRHVRGQGSDRQPTGRGPGTSHGGGRPQPPPAARPGRLRGSARAKGRGVPPRGPRPG